MTLRNSVCLWLLVLLLPNGSFAAPAKDNKTAGENPDSRGRATAIALNYCRASFHRIRTYQSTRVLLEEQEKILDNLNLNGIGDQEVINLYSAVLDEIGSIEIADRERAIFDGKYKRALFRELEATAFVALAQTATMSLDGLVRTGVRSWLDYRDLQWTREFDNWKIEKTRMHAVVDKSSRFLDTFWKQAKEKNIPDRWLIRGSDLDRLTAAIQEPDLQTRLRILQRMESFMECYPPYWYYVGRTQQGLGQFYEAAQTYDRLADLAHGHFRRDDMLTAALANRALIQQHLNQPGADRTAREALTYSTTVWEANLMCAQVLEACGRVEDAEDAILRNLDVSLETHHSSVALLGLYYRQDRLNKMAARLADPEFIAHVPMLSLVQCLSRLGPERTPGSVLNGLRDSIRVAVEPRFGADDLLVACGSSWQPERIQSLTYWFPGQPIPAGPVAAGTSLPAGLSNPKLETVASGGYVFRYARAIEAGNPLRSGNGGTSLIGSVLRFQYAPPKDSPESAVLYVTLGTPRRAQMGANAAAPWWQSASPVEIRYADVRIPLDGTWRTSEPAQPPAVAQTRSPNDAPGLARQPNAGTPAAPDADDSLPEFVPLPVDDGSSATDSGSRRDSPFTPSRRPPRAIILGVRPASDVSESRDEEESVPAETVPPPPVDE